MNEKLDIRQAIAAQAAYCKEKGYPHFAPRTGKCAACGRQIYEKITVEKAGTKLITGCPYCFRSYCD